MALAGCWKPGTNLSELGSQDYRVSELELQSALCLSAALEFYQQPVG